jgi:hypothetical protein
MVFRCRPHGFERLQVRVFVSKPDLKLAWASSQHSGKIEPWPASAGADIDDRPMGRGIQHTLKHRCDGRVGARKMHAALKGIRDLVAQRRGKPGLLVKFEELHSTHDGFVACMNITKRRWT